MREYSPRRRTAVVFTGSGASGAYHAGALKALDESGVKVDLVVGSGVGVLAAAFAAVGGGPKLYGPDGFWSSVRWSSFYALRPAARAALALLLVSLGVVAAPVALGLLLGLLFPLVLVADRLVPGLASRAVSLLWVAPEAIGGPYLAAQAVPVSGLALVAAATVLVALLRERRRFGEAFESVLDPAPALRRLERGVVAVSAGAVMRDRPGARELSRRYVTLLTENLGGPGFRELVLRTADLELGEALSFVVAREGSIVEPPADASPLADAVDLRRHETLFFDALATGVLCPFALPLRRVTFPRGAPHAGETHRLTDATFVGGCGIAEAVAAGAEQVIVVTGVPESRTPPARRRGPLARLDGSLRTLEAQAAGEIEVWERRNRMLRTLGHRTEEGRGAWQDPATGELHHEVDLWVIRPERRTLGPLDLDGARDPATDVVETTDDLLEQGFRDAHRRFIAPVVGQAPLPEREEGKYDVQAVEL